jgi:hypothetical protein
MEQSRSGAQCRSVSATMQVAVKQFTHNTRAQPLGVTHHDSSKRKPGEIGHVRKCHDVRRARKVVLYELRKRLEASQRTKNRRGCEGCPPRGSWVWGEERVRLVDTELKAVVAR